MDTMFLLLIVVLPMLSQLLITSTYNKYSKVPNNKKMTGKDVARIILDDNKLSSVKINEIGGTLSDHYDPRSKSVYLSPDIFEGSSISSVSVAAHEVGHAIQDKEKYSFLVFRSKMVPVVNFTSRIATILLVAGFFLEIFNLVKLGIVLLTIGLVFQLITLPVEFNASKRARIQLEKLGIINNEERSKVKKVLNAAAFTYVANFIASALQVVRLVLINRNRR